MIQETKMKKESLRSIKFSNMMSGEVSDSIGASRGILTLYKTNVFIVETIINEGNILLCSVFQIQSKDFWFFLNLYAPNNKRDRKSF